MMRRHIYVYECVCASRRVGYRGYRAKIWNRGTRPRNTSSSSLTLFLFFALFSSPAFPLSELFVRSLLESRLLPWQHRYGTLKTPTKAIGKERNGKERKDSPSLALSATSHCPSLGISSPSSSSFSSLSDQMFEKINKTLPADSFRRLLFSRDGRLCFAQLPSLSAPTRHFVCVTPSRGEPLQ